MTSAEEIEVIRKTLLYISITLTKSIGILKKEKRKRDAALVEGIMKGIQAVSPIHVLNYSRSSVTAEVQKLLEEGRK